MRFGRRRLFWQVYLHGVLLIVVVGVAAGLVNFAVGIPPWRVAYGEWLRSYLESRLPALEQDPTVLAHDLRHARVAVGLAVSIYGPGERLVGSNVDPPLPPPPPEQVAALDDRPVPLTRYHLGLLIPLRFAPGVKGYAVVKHFLLPQHVVHTLGVLLFILALLALASVPLARGISAPLERLTAAAQRLGSGDLSARAGFTARGEVGSLAAAFDDMAARLERVVRGEKELLANVSHELRTPLARIRVALELAAEGDERKARECLAEIGADLGELERLVADVMTAARLDLSEGRAGDGAGLPPLHRATVDARALIDEAAARFRSLHPAHPLAVDVEGAADAFGSLGTLEADASLLRRALDNLLDNAAKYSEAGGAVRLAARRAGAELTVEIHDRGIGIDPADLPHLFTPFFRTDRSRARGTGGVGLGLVLARRIVEAHGGRIAARSAPGDGTTFTVTLPA